MLKNLLALLLVTTLFSIFITTQHTTTYKREQYNTQTEVATEIPKQNDTKPQATTTEVLTITPLTQQNKEHSDTDETYNPETSPCDKPIGYKLGNFDARFSISKEDFLQTANNAVNIWNKASGKEILYYNEQGPLTLNLIYDERQAKTTDQNYLVLEIQNAKENASSIQKQFELAKKNHELATTAFAQESEVFQNKRNTYEAKVNTYNTQGGATQSEYDAMNQELQLLRDEAKQLDRKQEELTAEAQRINEAITKYNTFVTYINKLVTQSNKLGTGKFTEGRFVPSTATIDIYQFDSEQKLLRVLAHEFGHALGIKHTTNAKSIMYYLNSATTTTLSKEDMGELSKVCNLN